MERFAFNLSEDVRSSLYKICRLCGIETSDKITIAEEIVCFDNNVNDDEPSLCGKIFRCIGIQVEGSDNMPQSICRLCFDKINDFFEFREMCLCTDQQTRKLLRVAERVKYNVEKGTQTENILHVKPIKRTKNVQSSPNISSQPKTKKLKIASELHKSATDVDVPKKVGKPKKNFKVEQDTPTKLNKTAKIVKIGEHNSESFQTSKQTKAEDETSPTSADISKAIKEEKHAADTNINKNLNSDQKEDVVEDFPQLGVAKPIIKKKRRRFVKRLTYVKKKKRGNATTMDADISLLKETAPQEILEDELNASGSIIEGEKEKCTICHKLFLSDDIVMHMQTSHIPRVVRYYCVYCSETISNKVEIKSHNLWHKLSKTPFKCGRCDKMVDTLIGYTKHIHECSNFRPLKLIPDINCEKCNEQFATQNLYNWHSCIIESRLCPKCNKKVAKKNNMMAHVMNCLGVIQRKVKTEKDTGTKTPGHLREEKLLSIKPAAKTQALPDTSREIKYEDENDLLEITESRFDSIDYTEIINSGKEVTLGFEDVLKNEFEFVNIKEEPLEESEHSDVEMELNPQVLHLPVISEIKVKEEIINPEYGEEDIADEVNLKQTTADVSEEIFDENEAAIADNEDSTKPTIKLKIKKHHGRLNSSLVCENNSSAEDSPVKKKRKNINQLRNDNNKTSKEILEGEETTDNHKNIGKEFLAPISEPQCNLNSSENIPVISGVTSGDSVLVVHTQQTENSQEISNKPNDINNCTVEAEEASPENTTLPVIASVSSGVENIQIENIISGVQETQNISNVTFAMPQITNVSGGVDITNNIEFVQIKTEYENEEFYDNITNKEECETENTDFVNVSSDQTDTENICNIEKNLKCGNIETNEGGNDLAGFAFKKIKLKLPAEETSFGDSMKSESVQQKDLKVISKPRKKRIVKNVGKNLPIIRNNTRPKRNINKNISEKVEEFKLESNNTDCNKTDLTLTKDQQDQQPCKQGNDNINATDNSDLKQVDKLSKNTLKIKSIPTTKDKKFTPVKTEKNSQNKKKEYVFREHHRSSDWEDLDNLPLDAIPKVSHISQSVKLESSSKLTHLKTENVIKLSNLKRKESKFLNKPHQNKSQRSKMLSEKKQSSKAKNKNNYSDKNSSVIMSESSEDSSSSTDSENGGSGSSSDQDSFDYSTSSSESYSQAFGDDTSDLSTDSDEENSPTINKKRNKIPEKQPLPKQITTQIKRKPLHAASTSKINPSLARKFGKAGRSVKKSILNKKLATPNIFIRSAPKTIGKKGENLLNILCKNTKQNKLISEKKDDNIAVSHVQALGNFATQFNFSENLPAGGIFSAQKLQRLSEDDSMESSNKDFIKECNDLIHDIEEDRKKLGDDVKNMPENINNDKNREEQDNNGLNKQNVLKLEISSQNDNNLNNSSTSPYKDIKGSTEIIQKELPSETLQSTSSAADAINLESKSLTEEQPSTLQNALESSQCHYDKNISSFEALDEDVTLSKSIYSGFDTIIANKSKSPENFSTVTIAPVDQFNSCETNLPTNIPEDLTIKQNPAELIEDVKKDSDEAIQEKSNLKVDCQLKKSTKGTYNDDYINTIPSKKVFGDFRKKNKIPQHKPQYSRFNKDTEKKFSMFDRGYSVLSTCKQESPRASSHISQNLSTKQQNIEEKESNLENDKYRHKIFNKPCLHEKESDQVDLKVIETHENTTTDPSQISLKDTLQTIYIDTSSSNSNVPEILKPISTQSFGKDLCLTIESSDQDSSSLPKKFDIIASSTDNLSGINLGEISITPRYLQKLDVTACGESYNTNLTDTRTDLITSSLFLPGSSNLTQLPETTLQISSNTSRLSGKIDKKTSTYVPNFLLANPEISILPYSSSLENINIIAENHNNANLEKQLLNIMDLEDISSDSNLDSDDLVIQEEPALNTSSQTFNWSTQKPENRFLPGD